MADKFESNEAGNYTLELYGATWVAQTFTPAASYSMSSVKLYLNDVGSPPALTISIRATSGGLPTGEDLASGTVNAPSSYDWVECTFSAPVVLSAGTMYAIVIRCPTGNASNYVQCRESDGDAYADGDTCDSADSGATWSKARGDAGYDELFQNYGSQTAPTVTQSKPSNIQATVATGHGNITDLGVPNPTQHGHCWNRTGTPTTSDSKTELGAASATGGFTSDMTDLQSGQRYYVRSYVTNDAGTSYSSTTWSFIAGGGGEHKALSG